MQPAIVEALACPHEHDGLTLERRVLGCSSGHRFDLAKQGYATLIRRPLAHGGDPAPLIARRLRVREAGLLDALHDAVVDAARSAATTPDPDDEPDQPAGPPRPQAPPGPAGQPGPPGPPGGLAHPPGIVCDVGSGPGTYLAAVLDVLPDEVGLAIDASRAAARRAARCHPRAEAVVADVWDGLPVRTGTAWLLLDIFAPRNLQEFARVLAPGGHLLVMIPARAHLAELRTAFDLLDIEHAKQERLLGQLAQLPGLFETAGSRRVTAPVTVTPAEAADLVGMGASGHHLDDVTLERQARKLPARTQVTLDVTLHQLVRTGAAAPQ